MFNFRSKITQRVLPYLLLNPQSELYLNEMVVKFGVDRGNLSLYRINMQLSIYKELKAITEKQFGLEDAVRLAVKQVAGVKQAYIFGSYTTGKFGPESDVDVLVVGSHKIMDVQKRLAKVQKKFDREINVVDMTEAELVRRKKTHDPLARRIFGGPNIKLV